MKDEWEMLSGSGKLEAYFLQLLATLERMTVVMERFDNVMNPTLGMAEESFANDVAGYSPGHSDQPPVVRLRQVD